jgi:acyl-CoA thioester hydrolase
MSKLVYKEKIYTYQIDFVGHVSNIVYIQWLEHGRLRMMEAMGYPIGQLAHNKGIVPVLTETRIQYKRPLFLHNEVRIELWISRLNNASAIMEFNLYNEKEELCATAQQKGLFLDRSTQRPARLTAEYREAFEKLMNEKTDE